MSTPKRKDTVRLTPEDFGMLATFALRYSMGRQTYAPDFVINVVRSHLDELTYKDLYVMLQDCEAQKRSDNYGSVSIDKPSWLKWHKEVQLAIKRLEGNNA